MAKQVPVVFYTNVRKVEAIGGNCLRIYCSIERNGVWEDRVMLELPAAQLFKNVKFVLEAASEFYEDTVISTAVDRLLH